MRGTTDYTEESIEEYFYFCETVIEKRQGYHGAHYHFFPEGCTNWQNSTIIGLKKECVYIAKV